ncbi:MAG: type II toxin-antitoxin system VapC family toxin [Desulfamplus sp.]|nr:type II toxin-antitoxin system VapC family toxin [Desulfamplus sp.]
MKYLLDTDAIAFLYDDQREENSKIIAKLETLKDDDILFISILSLFELEYSFANTNDNLKKSQIRTTINDIKYDSFFNILSINTETSRIYGEVKSTLKNRENISRSNIKKHNIDIILASTALQEGCTLVSGDSIYLTMVKHKPELLIQTWW